MSNVTPFDRNDVRPEIDPVESERESRATPIPIDAPRLYEGKRIKLALYFRIQKLWCRDEEIAARRAAAGDESTIQTTPPIYMEGGPGLHVEGGILVSSKP